nr:RNA-dependent RNA polymerase 6 [Tanacetum cinerariifolium]
MLVENDVAYNVITTSYAESETTSSIMFSAVSNRKPINTFKQCDIRVLKAVNMKGLEHLVDRLIFPYNGERPHTDEASRSDLDGDLYFLTWDDHLILPSKQSWPPMEYTTAEAKELPREDCKRTTLVEKAQLLLLTKAPIRMSSDTKRLGKNNGNTKRRKMMEKHVTTMEEIGCRSGGVVSVSKIFVILKGNVVFTIQGIDTEREGGSSEISTQFSLHGVSIAIMGCSKSVIDSAADSLRS